MADHVLGIFAKQPVAGRVKTRLCPPLSPQQAAELYRTCLQETVAAMAEAPAERVIFYDGDVAYFQKAFPGLRLVPQCEGDLGRRLDRAFAQLFAEGCSAAALIGSDSPDLPISLVSAALKALTDFDLAVAPALDGGYVLIGQSRHVPELFQDMPWSSANLWPATLRRAKQLGLAYKELDAWEDLDDLASLKRLLLRSPHSRTAHLADRLLNCQTHFYRDDTA
ncbi:MAG: TIGR04282 family arsenosugar biosynthesis glycosyltransferase [Desulfuromonadaceae bacterium]|nr:TIGR04282 family arsenosugar biosynthesis glycosyltransferase [Desulfuromonadaceae bacterium]